jgi:hypothetical protein
MTMEAAIGFVEVRNWWGRSFWAYVCQLGFVDCNPDGMRTRLTFAFPLSFTFKTKDSSSPVVGSVSVRKA